MSPRSSTKCSEVVGANKQDTANVLDEAEYIINAITPEVMAEFAALDKSMELKKKGKSLFSKKVKKKKKKK